MLADAKGTEEATGNSVDVSLQQEACVSGAGKRSPGKKCLDLLRPLGAGLPGKPVCQA